MSIRVSVFRNRKYGLSAHTLCLGTWSLRASSLAEAEDDMVDAKAAHVADDELKVLSHRSRSKAATRMYIRSPGPYAHRVQAPNI